MKTALFTIAICLGAGASRAETIVETDAYRWHGDTITQGVYMATAPSPTLIRSTYSAQPGYYMGIDKEWRLRNDISAYPQLKTPNRLHEAIYNMGLDEMVNAVEPDTTLRTGKEWAGVWTRDVSYSILLSMAYMQPEASKISLMKKVDSSGRIIQDTGSGGAWPVSTDREIWCVAAWEVYKVTGDRQWLEYIYPIMKRSLETDKAALYDTDSGLVRGETSFIDWREQSHPRWMQCADIYKTETLSTSAVHARAWRALGEAAEILGHAKEAEMAFAEADRIAEAINAHLWLRDKGYYAMYRYGRDNLITNPRAETLGEALAIMWDIAPAERALTITESNPTTPFGAPVFYPSIADMPAYHNKSLWPWVASWWGLANAKAGNERGVMEAIGSVFRPAALFCTNKENLNVENGDIATELNSSNMLWCLSGNLALTHKVLFGIDFRRDGLALHPFVPKALAATRTLTGFPYRDAKLDITVSGYGDRIKSLTVNGREHSPLITPEEAKGTLKIDIVMADNDIKPAKVNHMKNASAPLTPTAWLEGTDLHWNPIEYIGEYIILKDGVEAARTRATSFDASEPGEYQVVGVAGDGTESFASEPRSTRKAFKASFYPKELDKKVMVNLPVEVDEDGYYFLSLQYANGNGPVNTENKCAVRTLSVDKTRVGTVVMPQRGKENWDDLGWTNSLKAFLKKGKHTVTLEFRPEDENMNVETNHARIHGIRLVKD